MVNAIFGDPAFRLENMTASILEIPFTPTTIRSLGIFQSDGVNTSTLDVEFDLVNTPSTQPSWMECGSSEPPRRFRRPSRYFRGRMTGMAFSHDATLEHLSLGACTGIVYDSDGQTVLYNFFDEFGVAQDVLDFDLGDTSADPKLVITKVKRLIEKALGVAMNGSRSSAFVATTSTMP
ncbi:hypothetical protein U1Q18_052056 [Sarracenia purpurea var. burkii]